MRLRRWLPGRVRRDADLDEEIRAHLRMAERDRMERGETAGDARANARREFGNVLLAKEATRAQWDWAWIDRLALDLRFALRQLRKNVAFTATAVLVLALGMCASIAIFAFADAGLIRPLPYPDPSSLVEADESSPQFPRANLSYPDYVDWNRFNTTLRSLDVFTGDGFLFVTPSGAEPAYAGRVSPGFFRTLGVKPLLGRDFLASEGEPGGPRVVMLSYRTWRKRFGGNEAVAGTTVRLSGELYTIIGVLPEDFRFAPLGASEFWTTLDRTGYCAVHRNCHNLDGIARLKAGVSIGRAQANLSAIARQLERQYPDSNRDQGAIVISLSDAIAGGYRPILLMLMAGSGLLLLIACVNVTSLVLVRSESRRREMAVRSALGASLTRLLSQFLAESAALVLLASTLGLALANWTMQALEQLIPGDMLPAMPFLQDLGLNRHVLGFTGALACAAVLLFSLTPAFHFAVSKMQDGLTEGSRGSAGRAWRRLGSRLVTAELAIAMVLLVGSGLFGKSLYKLLHVPLGFRPDHLATIMVVAPDSSYATDEQKIRLQRDIVSSVEKLPGVQSAALTIMLPVSFNGNTDWIRFVGRPYDGKHIEVNERDVSTKFFQTIGAKLARGRFFTETEDVSKLRVAIVNETFAKKYFPGENPIGKQFGDTELNPKSIRTIVGVVGDIKDGALDSDIWPVEYHPFNQDPNTYFRVIARTAQKPEAILPELSRAIHQIHPDVGTDAEATMERYINNSMTAYLHRSAAWLVGGFAALALLLGVVGLYGVIAYSVSQRTREIGVRMALGAEHRAVYQLVLKEAGWLVAIGAGAGGLASVAAATLARKLLFGVRSWDVQTILAVAVLLGIAAAAASLVPAHRAASVNPVEALRTE